MSVTNGEAAIRLQPLGEAGGAPIVLEPGEPALVGRSQTATVCVPHPSVSRSHALIELRGDRWFLTDLGSRHGTQVNGVELTADRPAPIAVGDMLRVGPVTFRVESGAPGAGRFTTTDREARMGTIVERVPSRELEALARLRLDLLMDAAAEIHRAPSEEALAEAILELALAGSGYPRAAVLRYTGSLDEVEVLAARDQIDPDAAMASFSFSRSLLGEAAAGHVARMMEDAAPPPGQSIVQLGIQSALCAPILLDDAVIGLLYLDSRHSERPGQRDSGGFCHAVARLAGLALANLKRADLAERQERLEKDLAAAREAQSFLLPSKKGVL
ncbi:MAG: FHA domain-containing protein, partial [Phycisphaerae bacterium]|nr:FHA domain-containing protein [Phycisphaerae bacterium]